jgi:hypothetical protein
MPERVQPQNKAELLDEIEREWSALIVTVERLGPEKMLERDAGGWTPKDNLAHLTEWMKVLLGYHMDKRPAAEVANMSFEDVKDWDIDRMNKIFFERNRDRSLEEVVDELKLLYSEIVGRLESMPFEELMQPRFPDQPERGPLLAWVLSDTSEHFAEHRASMEKAVQD